MSLKNIDVDEIFNDGERLVPFLSHQDNETIRHIASHSLFKQIILKDSQQLGFKDLELLDLGFGAGYASFIYASMDNVSKVKSIDVSDELVDWAKANYHNKKIQYEVCDAKKFLRKSKPFSYILTRHVLEHIEDGLNVIQERNFNNRLCINVPYNEAPGNPYHVLAGITEKDFPKFENVEFFYEDLEGNTYSELPKGIHINSIVYIASKKGLPRVKDYFTFPVMAPSIETIFNELSQNNFNFVENILSIQNTRVKRGVKQVDALSKKLEVTLHEVTELRSEKKKLQNELKNVYRSKRWKYSSKIAEVKKTLKRS